MSQQPFRSKAPHPRRRTVVRRSGVHGRGVYAQVHIPAGEYLFDYEGEVISWDEAMRRHPYDPEHPDHTFFFQLEQGGQVIDPMVGGNSARWINHSCEPNCQAREEGQRVRIYTLRELQPGEELFYDYGLVLDERYTPAVKKRYACFCGSASCRRTMLAPKR
ncbi:SET domain-containing protein [Roseateles sp. BYS180W]|uniref:SET domain-containing protein n=1 Tax=Roseateles rivi TaxID=3299028 RepID=A0ABW7FT78_9BURK